MAVTVVDAVDNLSEYQLRNFPRTGEGINGSRMMNEYYQQLRFIHIAAVISSGLLFLIRGAAMGMGAKWTMITPLRYFSYIVDTILLAAALTLTTVIQQYPFVNSWLTMKVVLLAIYIVLGSFALKRGKTPEIRLSCWLAALIVYCFIISVALTKDMWGIFR